MVEQAREAADPSFPRLPESAMRSTESCSCLVPRMCAAHPCRDGPRAAARSSRRFTIPVVFVGYKSHARMNPAGRDASVAPDFIAALSCFVVTDRSWWFAGMTNVPHLSVR